MPRERSIKVQEADRALQRDLAKRSKEDLRPALPSGRLRGCLAVKLVAIGNLQSMAMTQEPIDWRYLPY